MSGLALIPVAQIKALQDDVIVQGGRNKRAMFDVAPWLDDLDQEVFSAAQQPGSQRAKYNRLKKLADRVSAAAEPHVACRKGCSECCNIAVVITSFEAELIGEVIRKKPLKVGVRHDDLSLREKYFGQPCTFLRNGMCSIYADRPLACRTHFNLSDTSLFCSTEIPPEDSRVPNLDFRAFWASYGIAFYDAPRADIREFFPGKG